MKREKMKKSGFTMVEILIVIGIIGLLAALIIPVLIQKSNDRELVSQTIKVANLFSNNYKDSEVLYGFSKLATVEDQMMYWENDLKMSKNTNDEYEVHLLSGARYNYDSGSDGCSISYWEEGKPKALENVCFSMIVDVNGKKGPNTPGKDIYRFYVTKQGVFPDGNPTGCEEGYDCGAYVLANHKLWDGEIAEVASQNPNPPNCSGNCGSPSIYAEEEETENYGLTCKVKFLDKVDDGVRGYLCKLDQEYVLTISLDDYLTLGRSDCSAEGDGRPCDFIDMSVLNACENEDCEPTKGQYQVVGDKAAYMVKSWFPSTYAEFDTQCKSLGFSLPTNDSQVTGMITTHDWNSDSKKWYITGSDSGISCGSGKLKIKKYGENSYNCVGINDWKVVNRDNDNNIRAICVGDAP